MREEDVLCLMCSYSIEDVLVVTVSTGTMLRYQVLTIPTACFATPCKEHRPSTPETKEPLTLSGALALAPVDITRTRADADQRQATAS